LGRENNVNVEGRSISHWLSLLPCSGPEVGPKP
jgi:hypothetical protein